jgi:hypothetical protein
MRAMMICASYRNKQVEAALDSGVVKHGAALILSLKDFCGPNGSENSREAQVRLQLYFTMYTLAMQATSKVGSVKP